MSSLIVKTAILGYHVYRVVWEPHVGESFVVLHESGNDNDRHAMAIYRDEDPDHVKLTAPRTTRKITRRSAFTWAERWKNLPAPCSK